MSDCVEVSRVSRVASDAAWYRSSGAERRWGVEYAFSSWCGAAGRRGAAQRRRRLGMDFARNIFMVHRTRELGGLLLMLTGVGWTDRACIKCSAWSDHVFWRSKRARFGVYLAVARYF